MKDINLSSMISLAQEVFDILKNEYRMFLSDEKIDFIENLDFSTFFKETDRNDLPPIYLSGETYYLNKRVLLAIESLSEGNPYASSLKRSGSSFFQEMVLFMCLSLLCGDLNPLKLGLMESEIRRISLKYGIKTLDVFCEKELEVATLVKEKLLTDVPFNIIFKEDEIEIFKYLADEKGVKVATLYHHISDLMRLRYNSIDLSNFDLDTFLDYYNQMNYQEVFDLIYDFISTKVR